jgi:hypothetical protein
MALRSIFKFFINKRWGKPQTLRMRRLTAGFHHGITVIFWFGISWYSRMENV